MVNEDEGLKRQRERWIQYYQYKQQQRVQEGMRRVQYIGTSAKYYEARKARAEAYYTWKTIEPTLSEQQRHIVEHSPSSQWIKRRYETLIEKRFYDPFMTQARFEREAGEVFDYGYTSMPDTRQAEYLRRWGTFGPEGKTWEEMKQEGYKMTIESGRPEIFKPTTVKETGPSLSGFASYFLNISGYAYTSLVGTKEYRKEYWTPESKELKQYRLSTHQMDIQKWEEGDIGYFGGKIISHPYTLAFLSYGLGYGLETLKLSKFGQKKLFEIGLFQQKIGTAPEWTYKYSWTVTPSAIAEKGISAGFTGTMIYGGYGAAKEGRLGEFVAKAGMMFPFVYYPYKWGRISGRTGFQRRAEMVKLTDPVARIRQRAGYELIDETYKLPRGRGYGDLPYDIRDVHTVGGRQADVFGQMVEGGGGPFWTGSGAMKAQYRWLFRTGREPPGTLGRYAISRYTGTGPAKLPTTPHDIDIYFLTKTASKWSSYLKTHDIKGIHVHPYKGYTFWGKELPIGRYAGQYVELGVITQPPIRTTVYLRGITGAKTVHVWGISPKEQFTRMIRNLLPSKSLEFGKRSIKDLGTWTDTSFVLKQTAHPRWLSAYTRFSFPEQYLSTLSPKQLIILGKPTIGEKIVIKLGGPAPITPKGKLTPITTYGTIGYKDFYVPPVYGYPQIMPIKYMGLDVYKTTYQAPTILPSGYPQLKPSTVITPPYKPSTTKPPDIIPPSIVPPVYSPPTKIPPTDYPPTVPPPPTYPPSYPPPYYPPPYYPPTDYPPTVPPPPTKKPPTPPTIVTEKPKLSREGYDVFVKDRFIVSGKKKYEERFIKLSKKPMTRQDALSFGAEIVDQSAAASFKIKRAPTPPGQKGIRTYPPPIRIRNWSNTKHMFYTQHPSKRKTPIPVYVERTGFRINTPGEIQGISARGWLAQRMGKRRKPRKKKRSRRISYEIF